MCICVSECMCVTKRGWKTSITPSTRVRDGCEPPHGLWNRTWSSARATNVRKPQSHLPSSGLISNLEKLFRQMNGEAGKERGGGFPKALRSVGCSSSNPAAEGASQSHTQMPVLSTSLTAFRCQSFKLGQNMKFFSLI